MYRHIRKLRLTCIREADAHHGRILLEDALRTARLGDDTQFIVVRRLDLGAVPSDATATEWSRTVEASYEELAASAVRCTDPRAARAPAVIFSDRQEPWIAWAERAAGGRACPEWFLRPALPSWGGGGGE